jgi:hypothetical protein
MFKLNKVFPYLPQVSRWILDSTINQDLKGDTMVFIGYLNPLT